MKNKSLVPWFICLLPTGIVIGSIGFGMALGLPIFQLAWDNYFLFALLSVAAACPLSKIVMMILFRKSTSACVICEITAIKDSHLNQQEIERMRHELKRLNQQIRELNQQI